MAVQRRALSRETMQAQTAQRYTNACLVLQRSRQAIRRSAVVLRNGASATSLASIDLCVEPLDQFGVVELCVMHLATLPDEAGHVVHQDLQILMGIRYDQLHAAQPMAHTPNSQDPTAMLFNRPIGGVGACFQTD